MIFNHLLTIDAVHHRVYTILKMDLSKEHFRHVLLLYFNQKKTAAESHRILIETYGDVAPSIKTCEYWFRRFKSGDFNVNDEVRSGQPQKMENADLQALLDENPAQSTSELARALNVDRTTVTKHLHDMGKICKEGKWISHQSSRNPSPAKEMGKSYTKQRKIF